MSSSPPDSTSPASKFLRDIDERCTRNPLDSRALVFDNVAVLVLGRGIHDPRASVEIRDIRAIRTGGGAAALTALCELADQHGCELYLHAKGYAQVPTSKLVPYYERFGFTHEEGNLSHLDDVAKIDGEWEEHEGVDMMRKPR